MPATTERRPSGNDAAADLIPVTAAQLKQIVQQLDAPVVVVNMWATWCLPCREEFPDLVRLQRDYRERGLRLVLVSWDVEAGVAKKFLAKQGVDFPSYIRGDDESDPQFIDGFEPRWGGAFPTSFIYDRNGQLRALWEGKRTHAQFKTAVDAIIRPNLEPKEL